MSVKRREFTKKECDQIKKLLQEKVSATEKDQKRIWKDLRNTYGCWISFFTDEKPFTPYHFQELLKTKVITVRN